MNDSDNPLSKLFDNTPRICEKCSGPFEYRGAGEYRCKNCGFIAYDDYGKVRKFIDEHGPAPYHVVRDATGVDGKRVKEYLTAPETGREVKFDKKCRRCGCRITSGTYCSACSTHDEISIEDKSPIKKSVSHKRSNVKLKGKGISFVVDRNKR